MKKQFITGLCLTLFCSASLWAYSGGNGTETNPYQISTVGDWLELIDNPGHWDQHFVLVNSIDFGGIGLTPVAPDIDPIRDNFQGAYFTGTFDGQGFALKNAVLDLPDQDFVGLFGAIGTQGKVVNLRVRDVYVSGRSRVGGLAAFNFGGLISNCSSSGFVTGSHPVLSHAGGLVGLIGSNGTVRQSYSTCSVSGISRVGGLTGQVAIGLIEECYAAGDVSGSGEFIGGLVGVMYNPDGPGIIKNSYAVGNVSGSGHVGGLVGHNNRGKILRCYAAGRPVGTAHVGGLCGWIVTGAWYEDAGNFWDTQTSQTTHSAMGQGRTTAQMKTPAIFTQAGWDLDKVWDIIENETYPFLQALYDALGGGNGTAEDPYLIYTKEHLLDPLVVNGTWESLHFKLMDDIDFDGQQFPMLFVRLGFRGVFDGNHKCIKNASMQSSFMSHVNDPDTIIKNLTLYRPKLILTSDYLITAGLITEYNAGTIDNCHIVDAEILTPLNVGGGAGGITYSNPGVIKNSTFSGTIQANEAAGIAVDNHDMGIIENTSANVNIYALSSAGGLVSRNFGLIRNCSTSGRVENEGNQWNFAGGLVAINFGITIGVLADPFDAAVYGDGGGIILDSHSSCDVIANGNGVGGLVGISWSGAIRNCYASGSVTAYAYAGGLIGTIQTHVGDGVSWGYKYKGIVENCYATGNVSGNNRLGGFAGENGNCEIRNCYSTGNVTGSFRMGGFVGCVYNYPHGGGGAGHGPSIVDRCYSVGRVTGSSETGGFLGRHLGSQIITRSFWDTQTSGWTTSAGGTGRTTAQMKTQSTFTNADWNFTALWYMAGYPVLGWEINPLQAQIDAAQNGDVITVAPGVYEGRLYFKGKNITFTSLDPFHSQSAVSTILRGRGHGPVVTFAGTEAPDCVLEGFTIEGGNAPFPGGGGIYGGPAAAAMATIRHCIVQNNRTAFYGGGIGGFKGRISNCIIRDNAAQHGGGLSWCDGVIENCVIANNTATAAGNAVHRCNGQIVNCTIVSDANFSVSQIDGCAGGFINCIFDGQDNVFEACTGTVTYSRYPSASGSGNLSADPRFVDRAGGNYRLLPNSPCIDAGDNAAVSAEETTDLDGNPRMTDGNNDGTDVVDMGAYEFETVSNPFPIDGATDVPINTVLQWRGIGGGPDSHPIALITNGDFEIGTLAGWTLVNSPGSGMFVINNGFFVPASPDGSLPPYRGGHSAVSNPTSPGVRTIYQDVVLPAGAGALMLSWADRIRNHAQVFENSNQQYRVEILDLDNNLLATLFSTNPGDPLMSDWTKRSADISAFAGMTVRLAFTEQATLSHLNVHIDDVWIEPETRPANPVVYDVYLGTDPSQMALIAEDLLEPRCAPELLPCRVYYWQVVARNECGQTISPIWSFSTENTPPVANAGPDQTGYAWIDGFAQVELDGSASHDPDGTALTYIWQWNGQIVAEECSPTITLPVGVHEIILTVHDGIDASQPDSVTITVVAPIDTKARILPKVVNRRQANGAVVGWLEINGYSRNDVNTQQIMTLLLGDTAACRQIVLGSPRSNHAIMLGFFNSTTLLAESPDGLVEVTLVGRLLSGQWVYGTDTIRIINPGKPAGPKK